MTMVPFGHEGRKYEAEVTLDDDGALDEIEGVRDVTDEATKDIPDWSGLEDAIAHAMPEPEPKGPRHLRLSANDDRTLCGQPTAGTRTVHPSKVTRDDCANCRRAWRELAKVPPLKAGELVEFVDGSVWRVDEVRAGSAAVRCVLSGKGHKTGATLAVAIRTHGTRVTEAEFTARTTPPPSSKDIVFPEPIVSRKLSLTQAEIDKVYALRRLGKSYRAIEVEMDWPKGGGNRPFKICKGLLGPTDANS